MTPIPHWATEEEARAWLEAMVDDPCIDNDRFAFKDDPEAMAAYELKVSEGCCGYADYDVYVGGRLATIGCNYGH